VLLAIPLAMTFGFGGLVSAYAGWIVLGNLGGVWFLQTRIGISMSDFLRAIAGPFAIATLAAMVATPISVMAAPGSRADAITPFLLSSLIFCAVYLGLGWRLDYLPRFRGRTQHPQSPTQEPTNDALPEDEFVSYTTASEGERHDGKR
jgi:hypothetical protein